MSRRARARLGGNTAIAVIAAAAILLMVNYLAMRHYLRADWTASGIYTLSDKTEKVVRGLDRPVKMAVLWSQADQRFPDVKEILDHYQSLSGLLEIEVIDPDLSPDRVQLLIDRYGATIRADEQGMMGIEAGVFVVSGDNVKFVSSEQFEDFDSDMFGGGGEPEERVPAFKAEQELTAAILRVTADEQAQVCFTQGHGEWQFDGYGGRALGHIKESLRQDSYQTQAIGIAGAGKVPETCDLVVVAGPQRGVMDSEAKALDDYLEGGGRLLLLLDPIAEGQRYIATGLEQLTAKRGIKLKSDFVLEVDPRRLVSQTPVTFLVSEFTSHDAVKQLGIPDGVGAQIKEQLGAHPVVLSTARTLEQIESGPALAEVLARSSPVSWGEVDLSSLGTGESVPERDQYDTQGPATLAMAAVLTAAGDNRPAGRLVVVGDSDFLSEELFVSAGLFNRDLWSGLVGWLTAREDLISIAPKNPEHVRLQLTEEDFRTIVLLLVGEVLLGIVLGLVVWFRRRS
jgi:ABC-type uncharacterized transport system involved in gliding motility auxiliary subunit